MTQTEYTHMTTRSAPKKGSPVTTAKSLRPKTATAPGKRTATKKKTAPPASAPPVIPSGDEPQDAPRPLSKEQRSLDLLTRSS